MQMNSVNDPTVSSKSSPHLFLGPLIFSQSKNYCHGREGNKKFMTDLKEEAEDVFPLKNIRIFPKLIGRNNLAPKRTSVTFI